MKVFFLVLAILIGSQSFADTQEVSHIVTVRKGFDPRACADEIQQKTYADVVPNPAMLKYGVIFVLSSNKAAFEVGRLQCVASIKKNGSNSTRN